MNNYSSYYFYQKYETRSGSTTIPCYPQIYSLDADGTMPLAVRQTDDPQCGYVPVTYRWVDMAVSTNYICNGYDKYYKQKKQQSTDGQTWTDVSPAEYRRGDLYETNSPDCGYIVYRWVNMDITTNYVCDTYNKYYKQKKQQSVDGGSTWTDVLPAEYQKGDIYEYASADCGAPTPIPAGTKLWARYNDSAEHFVNCNIYGELLESEVRWNGHPNSGITTVVIGDCVTRINRLCFAYCPLLTSITIPNSVRSIGEVAFSDCSGLTNITLPESLENIEEAAFMNCVNLTSVTIPNSTQRIYAHAFSSCDRLESVTIGSGILSISEDAFSYCPRLTSFTIYATTPPSIGYIISSPNCIIYVPAESVNAYKTATGWRRYSSRIFPII